MKTTNTMQKLTPYSLRPNRRKYNDVLCKKLEKSNIPYDIRGYYIVVPETYINEARRVLITVSHTNPQY